MKAPEKVNIEELVLDLRDRVMSLERRMDIFTGATAPDVQIFNAVVRPTSSRKRIQQEIVRNLIAANPGWKVSAISGHEIRATDPNGSSVIIKYHYSRPHPDKRRGTWNGWHCTDTQDLASGIDWHIFVTHDKLTGQIETFLIPNCNLRLLSQGKPADCHGRHHWYLGHHNTNGTFGEYRDGPIAGLDHYVNTYKL